MKRVVVYNVVAVLVLLFTLEFATRTISWVTGKGFTLSLHELDPTDPGITRIYKWHPFLGFTFKPNIELIGSHPNQKSKAKVFVDKHGFLSEDNTLDFVKLKNEIRIATIGGSTTANLALTYDENWPGYLGNLIQASCPEKKIRIINAGTPGFNTAQSIVNLALRVMPFKPDVVIIYHAYNDLKAIRPGPFKPDYSHIYTKPYGYRKPLNPLMKVLHNSMFYVRTRNKIRELKSAKQLAESAGKEKRLSYIPKEAMAAFENNIHTLVAIAKSGGASVILCSFATLYDPHMEWSSPNKVLANLSDLQKRDLKGLYHFTPGLTIPAIFDGLNKYNEILDEIASKEKVGWLDSANLVPHEDRYFLDRVHFSKAGAKRMAESIAPVVEKTLNCNN